MDSSVILDCIRPTRVGRLSYFWLLKDITFVYLEMLTIITQ